MATSFTAAREALKDRLAGLGVTATLDPAPLPQAVIVGLPEDITQQAAAGATCTIPVWVVGPAPATTESVDWMLSTLLTVLASIRPASAEADVYTISGKDCPAYRIDIANQVVTF